MSKIVSFIKSKYCFYLISISIFTVIALQIPIIADDYNFSLIEGTRIRITTFIDIINSLAYQYMNWNGRILGYAFTELCLLGDNHIVFTILFPIVNTVIIEEIFRIVSSKHKVYLYYIILAAQLSIHILVLNQVMFWICGWSIYTIGLIPLLYVVNYSKEVFADNNVKLNGGGYFYLH